MELHGFLNIDKPLGWTSHDVVGRIRRILGTKKVGHAGTLDPAATGVLVVGVGRATRFLDYVQSGSKSYVAHVVLGRESETADIDGRLEISPASDVGRHAPRIDPAAIRTTVQRFIGQIEQMPPKYSAIKQDGEPLHRKMRRGEHVDVPTRSVRIDEVDLITYAHPDVVLDVKCGPGVYIRSLARDIGEQLGSAAYLHHLVRTHVGNFSLADTLSLSELEVLEFPRDWTSIASAIDVGVMLKPAVAMRSEQSSAWYHGRSIGTYVDSERREETIRAYSETGTFSGIGSVTHVSDSRIEVRPRVVLASS
jgi:tRNA pseudouridine55 synthase